MPRSVVVTGAAGFIGTALIRQLNQSGHAVTGIDIIKPLSSLGRNYSQIDLLDKTELKDFLAHSKPSTIFHLAGGLSIDPATMVASNVLTTINLFESIRSLRNYHPRIVVIGSAAEYGERTMKSRPILEHSMTQPLGIYGWIKLMQTNVALQYAQKGENVVVARLFNILGPGIPEKMAAGKFALEITSLERESKHKEFSVADLRGIRDFLDIRDISEALMLLSTKGKRGEIYNICSQKGIGMKDLLVSMINTSAYPQMKFKENRTKGPGVLYSVGSCAKFKRITGWKPKYSLRQSIEDTLESYRQS